MVQETRVSILRHPSLLVDALLVLMILLGLWVMSGWFIAPTEPAGTFSMQLIPDGATIPVAAEEAPASQDVLDVQQHSQLTLR